MAGSVLVAGCGLFGNGQPSSSAPIQGVSHAEQVDDDAIRQSEREMFATAPLLDHLSEQEKQLKTALKLTSGRTAGPQGGPAPLPASENITLLRKAKIDLWIEPVTKPDGTTPASFGLLNDSYSAFVAELNPKIIEQTASKKEIKKLQQGSKYLLKLGALRTQVLAATLPTVSTTMLVARSHMSTMGRAAHLVHNRRLYEMEWTDEDYELVRGAIDTQRRAEMAAAISLGLMAAYQAVLDGAEPDTIDAFAINSLALFPLEAATTLEETTEYVATLGDHIAATKTLYVAEMRKSMGDEQYGKDYAEMIEDGFTRAEAALSQESIDRVTGLQERQEIDDCYRGEPIDPQSPISTAVCEDYARCGRGQAPRGPTVTDEICDTLRRLDGAAPPSSGPNGFGPHGIGPNRIGKGALAGAASMLPAHSPVVHALAGVRAVRNRDPRGVINAAVHLAPPGPARTALGLVATVINAMPKIRRARDRPQPMKLKSSIVEKA